MTDAPDPPIFSPALTEHLQQSLPEFLYHYTGQNGVLGIVKSGSLWATNISYMNDATEFALSLGLIRDSLSAALNTSEWEAKRYAATDPKRTDDAARREEEEGRLWRIAERIDTYDTDIYVSCFCKEGNLLSQWRGYTGGSYGYSLGFISSELKNIAVSSGFILGKCIYDSDLQKKIVNESLECLLTKGEPGAQVDMKDFVALMRYGALFKHPSFSREQEWRLVSTRSIKTFYRKGKSTIIPYTCLSISSAKNFGIDHAIVGPCPHEALSERSVQNLLLQYNIDASVKSSGIPFTDW